MDEVYETTSNKDNRRRRKASKRTCAICGREFYAVNETSGKWGGQNIHIAKYCSRNCWSVRSTIFNKCNNCGKQIKTNQSVNKKYCNLYCRNEGFKLRIGINASAYKGDKAGYSAKHKYLTSNYGKPKICDKCGSIKFIDWANISGKYLRDRTDWLRLCRKCHFYYDNRDKVFTNKKKI